jgi:tRNA (guanosine-2'-O-)-methyltransferase
MEKQRFAKIKNVLKQRQPDLTVITEDVHKAHNLSAIIRTCESVGIMNIHLVNTIKDDVYFDPRITAGADKWVQQQAHPDIKTGINYLREQGFNIYAAHLSDRTIDYRTIDYCQPTAFLLGAEKFGVSEEAEDLVDEHITIPMMGMTQSLNVSVASAIILFEARRQRENKGLYNQLRISQETYEKMLFEWAYPKVALAYQAHQKTYPPLTEDGEIDRRQL